MMTIGGKAWLVATLLILLHLAAMPPLCLARLDPPDNANGRNMQRAKQILQLLNDQADRLAYMNTPTDFHSSDHKKHKRKSRSSRKSKSSRASQTSAVNQLLSGLSRSTRMAASRGFGGFMVSRTALLPSDGASFTAPATLHVRKGVDTLTDTLVESSGALKSVSTSLVNAMGSLLDEHPELVLDKSSGGTDSLSKEIDTKDQKESKETVSMMAAVESQDGEFGPASEENGFAPLIEDDTANAVPANLESPNTLVDEGTEEEP